MTAPAVTQGLNTRVSVLYVDPRGPYPSLVADWWDETRDARNYAGPNPVVAHPPCGPWGTLRTLSREGHEIRELAMYALRDVRRFGGALEHPAKSTLFKLDDMPQFDGLPDAYGGQHQHQRSVVRIRFGHVALKETGIYYMGGTPGPLPPKRKPSHWCSGVHTPGARGKPPPGIKICSAEQRRRTPIAFARYLIALAEQAGSIS